MPFFRGFNPGANTQFIETILFREKLREDLLAQKVFLAIRDGNAFDIYHKGGKLFTYNNNRFSTHIKYAAVIKDNDERNYISESILSVPQQRDRLLIRDFQSGYPRIKENCAMYAGVEAAGVSTIYSKYSYLSNSPIVVLDIETSFEALPGGPGKQDRIDILLFNKETRQLKFVEAKEFTNKELWAERGSRPAVTKTQLPKYSSQIATKSEEIINAYCCATQSLNHMFGIHLPLPTSVAPDPTLLIFGFDSNQRDGRLKELLLTDGSLRKDPPHHGHYPCYPIGDVKKLKIENLWNAQ